MKKKLKLLIFAEGISMAHPTRMWELACRLDKDFFDIHFATSDNFHYLLEPQAHIQIYPLKTISNSTFNERLFKTQFPFTVEELNDFTRQDEKLINAIKPDLIMADFRLSAFNSAKKFKIPLINLIQYHWHPLFRKEKLIPYIKPVDLFGRKITSFIEPLVAPLIANQQLKIINEFQNQSNQKTYSNIFESYCAGDYLLFPDAPSLFPDAKTSSTEKFIGPIIWRNKATQWPPYWPKDLPAKPTIYLSMGSTGNHAIAPKIIKTLKENNFQILVSTSGNQYKDIDLHDVYASAFVPADKAISKANLVICNGGTSTTYHSLSKKIPVLAIPSNLDQQLHTHQLKKRKLAETENPDNFNVDSFLIKIKNLLESSQTKHELGNISEEITTFEKENVVDSFIKNLKL
jgi:UDP:flavonoid glycosyltransferase YjiC (YdhE family)